MSSFKEQRQQLLALQEQHKNQLNQTWNLVQQVNTPRNRVILLSAVGIGLGVLLYKSLGSGKKEKKAKLSKENANTEKTVSKGFFHGLWLKVQEELGIVLWDLGRKWLEEWLANAQKTNPKSEKK